MKADTPFSGDDLRRSDPKFQAPRFAQYLKAVDALDKFARDNYGKRVIHLAVRWVLDTEPLSIALWGARHPAQLDPIADAMGWKLDPGALVEIDRIIARHVHDPVGPEFMAPPAQLAA
jgi:aryl-alcohol dehydrogenase-like predicted oxidoreductase